jgi:hypothetical protein
MRAGGGAPILTPTESWAKAVPTANIDKIISLFFTTAPEHVASQRSSILVMTAFGHVTPHGQNSVPQSPVANQ